MDLGQFISIAIDRIRSLENNPACNIIKKERIGDPLEDPIINTEVYNDIPLVYISREFKVDDYYTTPTKTTTFYIKVKDLESKGINIDMNTIIEFEGRQYRIQKLNKIINLFKIEAMLIS